MLTIFVRNLPSDASDTELTEMFEHHGKVFHVKLAQDVFTGKCRGFAEVQMEGHEARAAIAALNGADLRGNSLRVQQDRGPIRRGRRAGGRRR